MSEETLKTLVFADPTTKVRNETDIKAGQYVNWIIKKFLQLQPVEKTYRGFDHDLQKERDLFIEDLYKVTGDLEKFHRIKSGLPVDMRDIYKYNPSDLYKVVKDVDDKLVKTTKKERKEAEIHPGAKLYYDGDIWRVVVIEKNGVLEKEAACFYGGYNKETRWCTSAPGLSHFESYIRRGPLYVVYRKNDTKVGQLTGLPSERFQFHFQDNMFMDVDDIQIPICDYLNGVMRELKQVFRKDFINTLVTDNKKLQLNSLTRGIEANIINLYGFDFLMKYLPETIEEIVIQNRDKLPADFKLGDISKFKNLQMMLLDNCISEVPVGLFELPKLRFLSLLNNYELKEIPESILNCRSLQFLCLRGSTNAKIPNGMKKIATSIGDHMWDFTN